ncbi:MAG: FAD:protein FMN transferase [Deltaproteobacteria bacterium]|nr:FAD:protein FMN transferase [Deltaproteobacteria bacterium]
MRIFFLILLLPTLARASEFSRTRILMGNVPVTLTVDAPKSGRGEAFIAMEKGYQEAIRIEKRVSEFLPNSDTSLLNRNAGKEWSRIGPDLLHILIKARSLSETTGGAFDITFASQAKEASFRDILLDPRNSRAFIKRVGTVIGVSSIAKGYIVDRMSAVLRKEGFPRHLVNAGGDVVAAGVWEVGIRNPYGGKALGPFKLTNGAISTSGNAERGKHIIDPRSRKPVDRKGSATVIAPRSALASPLATAAFVLGEDAAVKKYRTLKGVKLIFVD